MDLDCAVACLTLLPEYSEAPLARVFAAAAC